MLDPLPGCDLPIFRETGAEYALFYAPGCVVVTAPEAAGDFARAITDRIAPHPWGDALRQHAERAIQVSDRQRTEPFRPECLTLYLHNQCNLGCVYCYADPDPRRDEHLDPDAILAAAEVVATSCHAKGLTLTVVFHGGGEPALFQEEVERALALVEKAAQRYGLALFRYIATNGVMSGEKARWLATHFDLIGLSCDGPPDIQDQQRPRLGGGATSEAIARTADVFHQAGRAFHIRATITAATIHRQAEIADYLCTRLQPGEIHFEPVYLGGRAANSDIPDQADEFVTQFLAAREVAWAYGIPLAYSGTRPGVIHGPYCHVFRQVVNLVPPGVATACFKTTDAPEAERKGVVIGAYKGGRFELDHEQIHTVRRKMSALPDHCAACFNRYHCARACPNSCSADGPGGRCAINRRLAHALLHETAEALWATAHAEGNSVHGTPL